MKLTRRQEEFLHNLLDLYREQQEPLHYSVLAERLGVSRFTAYDMLRLLEEKGLADSSYQLGRAGPGRSEVVYVPTALAHRLIAQATSEVGGEDWEEIKKRLLDRLRSGEMRERALAEEMLARVPPDEPDSVRYCIEVMTVIALRLQRREGRPLLADYLPQILPAACPGDCRARLSLLGGFALGILAEESSPDKGRREWEQELLTHVLTYQNLVLDMEPELCQRVAAHLKTVFKRE